MTSDNNILSEARREIDEIDKRLCELFEKRMSAVKRVASYKQESGLPIFDPKREYEVIEKNLSKLDEKELAPYFCDLLKELMGVSKRYQQSVLGDRALRIGFQGTRGSFSQMAMDKYFDIKRNSALAQVTAFESFGEVFDAVFAGRLDFGVLPFSNSHAGAVSEVMQLLEKSDCIIYDRVDLKVTHCLLGIEGAVLSDIKKVLSHPQALMQCSEFISSQGMERVECLNTAFAAREIAVLNDKSVGAVASRETAELYHLKVIKEGINTAKDNTTKFIVIAKGTSGAN